MISLFRKRSRKTAPITKSRPLFLEYLEDRTVPTLLGQQLFPSDSPWNQSIAAAPVAANSAAVINNIISKYGNGRVHPDFSEFSGSGDLYGVPYNVVHGNSTPKVAVEIDAYPDESDIFDAPIPPGVVLEGDFQNGPRVGVDNRGDSHLIVYDVDNNVAYEYFRVSRPSENADGKWHADQQTVWDMKTNTFRTLGHTSADAAGLSILVGLLRPDEALPTSQGGQGEIDHAIRFTLKNNLVLDKYTYPASHRANPGQNNAAIQVPMGTRFRLKSSVNISALNPQSRVVAQAMKEYGLILADNGSNFFITGAGYAVDGNNSVALTWSDGDVQDLNFGLKSLRYSDFEVVETTPEVTSLSTQTGLAGTIVTITGRNFSGAAGRLQVLFGTVASGAVTVINDTLVTAVVPAGSGTVNVRVQSGIDAPGNTSNAKNPIFGYGISAVNANASFTYTDANQQWKFIGGSWTQTGGALSQTSLSAADPRKAVLTATTLPANAEVQARVRVDSWIDGDYARAGVGLRTDAATGHGYNLLFHGGKGAAGTVQFLDDSVKWGNSYAFNWNVGEWYVFRLRMDNGVLMGKVWKDGTAEPAAWQFTQAGWTGRTSGFAALNGGAASNGSSANSTVSFDTIAAKGLAAAPTGVTATAVSSSGIDVAWATTPGATGYRVYRSLDGNNGWTQVGTPAATSFSDLGLASNTTYFYRVSANVANGESALSAVVSAKTASNSTTLFSDTFVGPVVNPAWKFVNGSWTQTDGVLRQTSQAAADPRKAVLSGVPLPSNVEVQARVRVDSWIDGDFARAGVGLRTDAATGHGYNLLFHGGKGAAGTVQFLDDSVKWGNSYAFNWNVGEWYVFRLRMDNGVLMGKVWKDGTAEPAAWQFTQAGWTGRASGFAALNGGAASNGSSANSTVSFDDVLVRSV